MILSQYFKPLLTEDIIRIFGDEFTAASIVFVSIFVLMGTAVVLASRRFSLRYQTLASVAFGAFVLALVVQYALLGAWEHFPPHQRETWLMLFTRHDGSLIPFAIYWPFPAFVVALTYLLALSDGGREYLSTLAIVAITVVMLAVVLAHGDGPISVFGALQLYLLVTVGATLAGLPAATLALGLERFSAEWLSAIGRDPPETKS